MGFSVDVLTGIAIALQRDIGHQDRFQRLVSTLRGCLIVMRPHCCVMSHISLFRWQLTGCRRMFSAAASGWMRIPDWKPSPVPDVVRFPADSQLPDPYDGLIPDHVHLKVHACAGLPLFAGKTLSAR